MRRMRVRNEISCYRSTEGGTERAEDLEALREELHRLSKLIEEAETLLGVPRSFCGIFGTRSSQGPSREGAANFSPVRAAVR